MPEPETKSDSRVKAVVSDDLLALLAPVLDWYQSDERQEREPLDIIRDIVDDLQSDRSANLRMDAALTKIRDSFESLNGQECDRGCGKCIRCIAAAALVDPANSQAEQP
jgi:hypothetical protein